MLSDKDIVIEVINGKYAISIGKRQVLDIPKSCPVKYLIGDSGKGYCEGQYYVRFYYKWTKEEIENYECYDEYNEIDFRFDDEEDIIPFLRKYLGIFGYTIEVLEQNKEYSVNGR